MEPTTLIFTSLIFLFLFAYPVAYSMSEGSATFTVNFQKETSHYVKISLGLT